AVLTCTTTAPLASGASRTYHVKLVLDSNYRLVVGTSLANRVSVTADPNGNDPTPTNCAAPNDNCVTDTDTVTASSDLGVAKTDGVTSVIGGDPTGTTYTITLTNHGPSDEPAGIVISD